MWNTRLAYTALSVVTNLGPTKEPVTVRETADFLRISGTADDLFLASAITAARVNIEQYTPIRFLTQTWLATYPAFPRCERYVELPLWPVQSVDWLKYYDDSNVLQTYASANYNLIQSGQRKVIELDQDKSWPSTRYRSDAVQIQFKCGFGDTQATVPEDFKHELKRRVGALYEKRALDLKLPSVYTGLLAPYEYL